jgi:DNA-binding response OmpR family regulator
MNPSLTILLLDEEPMLRRATALMLKSRGGKVSAAGTLDEAVALTEERVFDVAVLDVTPEGPSAAVMVAELRARGLVPRRLVVCSPGAGDAGEAGELEFPVVLHKPYPFDHLLSAVFGPARKRRPRLSGVFSQVRPGRPPRSQRARPSEAPAAADTSLEESLRASLEVSLEVSLEAPPEAAREEPSPVEVTGVGLVGRSRDRRRAFAFSLRPWRRAARARRGRG